MIYIDVIGYVGGFVLGVQLLPQLYKTYKTKSGDDISTFFLLLNLFGLSCMCVYGILQNDLPLIIPAISSIVNTLVLLIMKIMYAKKNDLNQIEDINL